MPVVIRTLLRAACARSLAVLTRERNPTAAPQRELGKILQQFGRKDQIIDDGTAPTTIGVANTFIDVALHGVAMNRKASARST